MPGRPLDVSSWSRTISPHLTTSVHDEHASTQSYMSPISDGKAWDLSSVLELVLSLSSSKPEANNNLPDNIHEHNHPPTDIDQTAYNNFSGHSDSNELGNFSRVWQLLGAPQENNEKFHGHQVDHVPNKHDYASDGATYSNIYRESVDRMHWSDGTDGDDTADDEAADGLLTPKPTALTKNQRKKLRRKAKKALEKTFNETNVQASDSETDGRTQNTPANKASVHILTTTPSSRYHFRPRDSLGKAVTAQYLSSPLSNVGIARKPIGATAQSPNQSYSPNGKLPETPCPTGPEIPVKSIDISATMENPTISGFIHNAPEQQPVNSTPNKAKPLFVPSSVQPLSNGNIHSTTAGQLEVTKPNPQFSYSKIAIEPKILRSGEDRHWSLLLKLVKDFDGDRKHLVSPMNLTTHNNNPKGIHVFVDASNIFIGFLDQLKRSRGIPVTARVFRADLSFDALALLMERRRPVAKRVLVGSTPHLPAFDQAEAVGYECSILEKVYKARELTERQIYFRDLDRGRLPKATMAPPSNQIFTAKKHPDPSTNGNGSGSGGSSETNTPQYAPAKMIEQGVDEILHLKILESIVDTDEPSTIVLATGDAAQAEYSQGFMAMTERALKRGWNVELVSWSKNISTMYTKKQWADTWRSQFRIITLDDYAEELLDM